MDLYFDVQREIKVDNNDNNYESRIRFPRTIITKNLFAELSKSHELTNYYLLLYLLDSDICSNNKSLFNMIFMKCLKYDGEKKLIDIVHIFKFVSNCIHDRLDLDIYPKDKFTNLGQNNRDLDTFDKVKSLLSGIGTIPGLDTSCKARSLLSSMSLRDVFASNKMMIVNKLAVFTQTQNDKLEYDLEASIRNGEKFINIMKTVIPNLKCKSLLFYLMLFPILHIVDSVGHFFLKHVIYEDDLNRVRQTLKKYQIDIYNYEELSLELKLEEILITSLIIGVSNTNSFTNSSTNSFTNNGNEGKKILIRLMMRSYRFDERWFLDSVDSLSQLRKLGDDGNGKRAIVNEIHFGDWLDFSHLLGINGTQTNEEKIQTYLDIANYCISNKITILEYFLEKNKNDSGANNIILKLDRRSEFDDLVYKYSIRDLSLLSPLKYDRSLSKEMDNILSNISMDVFYLENLFTNIFDGNENNNNNRRMVLLSFLNTNLVKTAFTIGTGNPYHCIFRDVMNICNLLFNHERCNNDYLKNDILQKIIDLFGLKHVLYRVNNDKYGYCFHMKYYIHSMNLGEVSYKEIKYLDCGNTIDFGYWLRDWRLNNNNFKYIKILTKRLQKVLDVAIDDNLLILMDTFLSLMDRHLSSYLREVGIIKELEKKLNSCTDVKMKAQIANFLFHVNFYSCHRYQNSKK